jgi:hypothetical protein
MLQDLREQMIQEDELLELEEERHPIVQMIDKIEPWQRLVLAGMIFLDVAVCGIIVLIVTGRITPPF